MLSGLNRGSFAQSTRKRKKPSTFVVCPGDATSNLRGSFSLVRYTAVWHTAQLLATLGKPIVFLVKPTGSSCPSSQATPSAAYPPGLGRYSGNIRGNTMKIQ